MQIEQVIHPDDQETRNHYLYKIVRKADLLKGSHDNEILHFSFGLDRLSTSMKPADYWLGFHRGNVVNTTAYTGTAFGLSMEIHTADPKDNLAGLIKPMVDGIISALHCESVKDDEAEMRLVNSTGSMKDEVQAFLFNNQNAFLGPRNLLSSYRNGIIWNPHDDLCRKITLFQVIEENRKGVLITGSLHTHRMSTPDVMLSSRDIEGGNIQ